MNTIIAVKNIKHMLKLIKQYKIVHPISMFPSEYIPLNETTTLLNIERIRENNIVLQTIHTLIIGINNTLERVSSLSAEKLIPPILPYCANKVYYQDILPSVTIAQCLAPLKKNRILHTVLGLIDTQILIVKKAKPQWQSARELINNDGYIHIDGVPLCLQIELYNTMHYVVHTNALSSVDIATLMIAGFVELTEQKKHIKDIKICVYRQGYPLLKSIPELRILVGNTFPISTHSMNALLKKIRYIPAMLNLNTQQKNYLIQSLVSLLLPALT